MLCLVFSSSLSWGSSTAMRNVSSEFINPQPFHYQELIINSPYYLPQNSYDVSLENLVLDQLKSPNRYFSLLSSLVCLTLH